MKILKTLCLIGTALLLQGCAGIIHLPGGSDTINKSFYESDDDMKIRIRQLDEGMTKEDVFAHLGRHEDHFVLLGRHEVVSALYGGQGGVQNVNMPLYDRNYIKSLSGYKLLFKNVSRKHGVSSPISMRTNENGYSYSAIFIFKDDVLYERPVLSGGIVDASSTKTLFDYLSPQTVMGHVGI